MNSFISPCLDSSFLAKSGKNRENFLILLKMEKNNSTSFQKIQKYQKFLPQSFFLDKSAPFAFSFTWLQRIGRLDLNEFLSLEKKNVQNQSDLKINFKSDPMFRIRRKAKKRKKEKLVSPISVGKNKEEKMLIFDYNKKKINNKFLNLKSYSKKVPEKKKEFNLANFYSIISIQNNKTRNPFKMVIILFLFLFSIFIFYF